MKYWPRSQTILRNAIMFLSRITKHSLWCNNATVIHGTFLPYPDSITSKSCFLSSVKNMTEKFRYHSRLDYEINSSQSSIFWNVQTCEGDTHEGLQFVAGDGIFSHATERSTQPHNRSNYHEMFYKIHSM